MNRVRLSVTLTLRSPFLFPSLDAGGFGLDAVALRDRLGRPLIPQDQIRGVLRHALAEAMAAGAALSEADMKALFGEKSGDAAEDATTNFEPARGRLLFDDLATYDPLTPAQTMRVRIDGETGAADPGGLMFAELAAKPGAEVRFEGAATLLADDALADRAIAALKVATTWVSAIGAMKSAGFGEVVSLSVAEASRTPLTPATVAGPADRCCYLVTVDRPFLVDARRAADNIYVGSEIIPGAVVKGALARKLALMGEDPRYDGALSALSVSHAIVEGAEGPPPLSLIVAQGVVGDALRTPQGMGATIGAEPGRFSPDWKAADHTAALHALGRTKGTILRRSIRAHVAIDRASGVARDQLLFVTNAVDPGERRWRMEADFSRVAPAERQRLASAMLAGLDGVGRTGATLSFEQTDPVAAPPVIPVKWNSNCYAVVLQTDAVMCGPEDEAAAFNAYAAYWARACSGATLVNFFACQKLGGGYLGRRFQIGGHYKPFWVTEAGAVFLLSGAIKAQLEKLVRDRLPAPIIAGQATDWRTCPFQPENGYGAIRADYDAALAEAVKDV